MADCGVSVQFCWAHLIRDIRFLAEHLDRSLRIWGDKFWGGSASCLTRGIVPGK